MRRHLSAYRFITENLPLIINVGEARFCEGSRSVSSPIEVYSMDLTSLLKIAGPFGVLLTLVASAACTCRAKEAAPPPPPRSAGAYFGADVRHPWNRVFHALFDRQREIGHPACGAGAAGGCLGSSLDEIRAAGSVAVTTELGVDAPQAFIGEDVYFLRAEARTAAALVALADALQPDPALNPVGAVLLQSDLWERFDRLQQAALEGDEGAAQFRRLLPAIAKLMHRLALPRAQLDRLASNEGSLAAAFPDVLPGFASRDGWAELRKEREGPDGGFVSFTTHSEVWGSRMVFRIFARVPREHGGPEWFRAPRWGAVRLPEDTALLLTASPLALTQEGEPVAAPFFVLAEARRVKSGGFQATSLEQLPFTVLEAPRADLVADPRQRGGFHQLAADVPVPLGATCSPDLSVRVPLALSCVGCHADGAQLGGAFVGAEVRISLESDPRRAAAGVVERKRAQASFARLRQLQGAP
jgi:hypothetical protein